MAGTTETRPVLRGPQDAQTLVLGVLREHADSLLRVARHHSLCADDAQDAYQRGVEIFLRHAATLDADDAHKWIHTVVKHEAMRIRSQRARLVAADDVDFDGHESGRVPTADEHVASFDLLSRSAEALQRLKPQEVRALWLKAQGHSYQEIADMSGWSFTKVNRALTEGRRSFLARYAEIATNAECERWEPVLNALADGEASPRDLAAVRPHLRRCTVCRAHVRELRETTRRVAALLPAPVTAAAAGDHGGLLARIHDALFGHVQERVVAAAVKLQSGVEAALPAKLAVVAASAAVVGGGMAVERVVTRPDPPAPERAPARAAAATATPVAREPEVPRAVPARAAAAPKPEPRKVVARRTTTREFALSEDARTAASDSTAAREFSATSPSPATAASTTVTPIEAPANASKAERTAAAEFGG